MARTVTVSSIIDQVRQRADIENETDRFPDSELATYISQSWAELYNQLVTQNNDLYLSGFNITLTPGVDTYALPADYYLDRGLDFTAQGYTYTLARWSFEERELYQFVGTYTYGMPTAYRIIGTNVVFKPTPQSSGVTARLWYYPAPAVLSTGSSVDGIAGFEEYLVADAAIKALEKDARQSPSLLDMKANALQVMQRSMAGPSRSHPERIIRRFGLYADTPRRPYPR